MPVLPESSNNNGITANLPDAVTNPEEKKESGGTLDSIKAKFENFKSKGPQLSDNMPEPTSREELDARAAELNK